MGEVWKVKNERKMHCADCNYFVEDFVFVIENPEFELLLTRGLFVFQIALHKRLCVNNQYNYDTLFKDYFKVLVLIVPIRQNFTPILGYTRRNRWADC